MVPDYLGWVLTGVKAQEYTNASTTALLNAGTCDWDGELIDRLGLPRDIFLPVTMPGISLGRLRPEIAERVGFDAEVVLVASHDTGSAWLAVPARDEQAVYVSSGTWSLMGTENRSAICTPESAAANLTNEGGYERRFRYLKNIMGLWMIQSIRRELNGVDYVVGKNGDSKDIMIGNLTVTAGGLDIDYVTGNGKRTLTVNGDMAVKANTNIVDSKKITVTENLTVTGSAILFYEGDKANEDGLAVKGDITVSGATFDASDVDALNITCANFYLKKVGVAIAYASFGNRTDGAAKNLVVSGTISNPKDCSFDIIAANQDLAGSVLAWVTCSALEVGGNFTGARPRVE